MSPARQALTPLRTLSRRPSASSPSTFSPGTPTASLHTTSPAAQPALALGGMPLDIFDAPARLSESSARLRSAAHAALASAFSGPTPAAAADPMAALLPPAPVTTLHRIPSAAARSPMDGWVPARPVVTWSGTPPTADKHSQGIVFDGPARPRPLPPAMRGFGFSEPPDPSTVAVRM